MIAAARRNLLRQRDAAAPVTQIELFFDLVFVFAVTQLSQTLRASPTPLGALHTFTLFTAVWWVWVYTSWLTNWLNPEERPVRLLLIVMMLIGLALSVSLPAAFTHRGLVFAIAYVLMQLGRSGFMLWAVKNHDDNNYRNFQRVIVWHGVSAVFWLAGGVSPAALRTPLWLIAVGFDLAAPALRYPVPGLGRSNTADWNIDSDHLAERCAGFILIAIGESITVTGSTFFTLHWTAASAAAALVTFLGAVSLWWIYFDTAAERTAQAFAEAEDTGHVARVAYTYLHGVLVAGIIVIAVANAFVLDHPAATPNLAGILTTIGGPAIYLTGNGIFRRLLAPRFPPSHIFGLAALAALAGASRFLSFLTLGAAVTMILLAVAAIGSILQHRQTRQT